MDFSPGGFSKAASELEKKDTCASCKFCARVDLQQGQCRGAPPTPVVVGVTQQGPMIQSLFPAVILTTPACGRYEHKPVVIIGQTQGEA